MNNTATNIATCPTVRKQIGKTTYYRPCAFQPDRKRDNGGQNQAYAS